MPHFNSSTSTSGTKELIQAPGANKRVIILSEKVICTDANTLAFLSGSTEIDGTAALPIALGANGGWVLPMIPYFPNSLPPLNGHKPMGVNEAYKVVIGSNGNVNIMGSYAIVNA